MPNDLNVQWWLDNGFKVVRRKHVSNSGQPGFVYFLVPTNKATKQAKAEYQKFMDSARRQAMLKALHCQCGHLH